MKLHTPDLNPQNAGHTLLEMMFASAILLIVIMAMISAHLIGLRLSQLVQSKCGASDSSRRTLQQLPTDIRKAKMWFIGNMSGNDFSSFNIITNGNLVGNALKLCNTTNGSDFTLYYFDTSEAENGKLMKTTTPNWNPQTVCSNLINDLNFKVEDFTGTNVTTALGGRNYKSVIHVTLNFWQFLYPRTVVGTNGLYDYYKLEFKVTPHLPE